MKNLYIAPLPYQWEIYLLICIFLILDLFESSIRLEKIRQEIPVKEQYEFHTPEVVVLCACRANTDLLDETTCNDDSQSDDICIFYNNSTRAQCSVKIRPSPREDYFTAYKFSHTNRRIFFTISYSNGNKREKIDIPRGIFRVKTPEDSILTLDTSSINVDALNTYTWYYGERNTNNLKCGTEVNEANEKDVSKLGAVTELLCTVCKAINPTNFHSINSYQNMNVTTTVENLMLCRETMILLKSWYRLNLTTGKYDVDKMAVTNSLMIDDRSCPTGDVKWTFRAVHYYNHNGLLQTNLAGKTINEVMGGEVENVIINSAEKTISIEYRRNVRGNIHFLTRRTGDSFNFSAYVTVDKYANKMVHVTIHEDKVTHVNVEIGIPGETRSMLNFYHDDANEIHHYRISASLVGPQWICAYPTWEFARNTCILASYYDTSVPAGGKTSTIAFRNFGHREPPLLKRDSADELKTATITDDRTIIISVTSVLIGICFFFVVRYTNCFFMRTKCMTKTERRDQSLLA